MVNYVGDANANVHTGTVFKDTLDGQGGNDTLGGNDANDSILGGAGSDSLGGGFGNDTIYGGAENDIIDGSGDLDPDDLFGEDGNDIMYGRVKDHLDGGAGFDSMGLNLTTLTNGLNVDLSGLAAGGAATIHNITVTGFEGGFVFFSSGDDKVKASQMGLTLYGAGGSDTLLGGAISDGLNGGTDLTNDADVIKGGDGDDALSGGYSDLLDGGPGAHDLFSLILTNQPASITVNFAPLYTGGMVSLGGGTRVVRCESGSAQFGSGDDDIKTGSLAGQSGVIITAGFGNDTVVGGDGHDNIAGGSGNDVIRGGGGDDTANYQYEAAAVIIDLNITGFQDTGGGGIDKISECEWVNGGQGGDRIVGDGADNKFEGYAGNDTLIGGQGNDTLNGGSGGYNDEDRLSGGAGQDLYNGGLGADVLVWSSIFHTTVAAPDQIQSMEATDVIHVKDIDADITTPGDQAFTIVGSFTGVAGQMLVVSNSLVTQWQMDVDGDGSADGMFEAGGDHTAHSEYVL